MKVLTLFVAMCAASVSASAQKMKGANVPSAVQTSFAKQFPGIPAKWEKENGEYEAEFKQNGNESSALFTAAGVLTETEVSIQTSALPAAVSVYMSKKYPGQKVKEAARITKQDGSVNYEAEVKGKDIIFDAKGNFLKEVKHGK